MGIAPQILFLIDVDYDIYALPDTIRYSPKQSHWKGEMEISFQNNNKLVNDIIVTFSR